MTQTATTQTATTQSPSSRPADQRAIEEIFVRMGESWRRGDAAGYAALFTDDVDYVLFDGTRLRGRAENERVHQALFDLVPGMHPIGELESIDFVSPELAVVHASGTMLMPWQKTPTRRSDRSRQTYLFVRTAAGWRIRAFQNTRIKPMPLPAPDSLIARLFRTWIRWRTPRAAAVG
jgi:uncharacterized protein (TIGR02246 family)